MKVTTNETLYEEHGATLKHKCGKKIVALSQRKRKERKKGERPKKKGQEKKKGKKRKKEEKRRRKINK